MSKHGMICNVNNLVGDIKANSRDFYRYKIQDIYYEFSAHIGAHTEVCNG